jgi:hypothetical protein
MGTLLKFFIGVWLAITAFKFISGLSKAGNGKPVRDASVLDAEKCPVCGVFGDQPCRNCNKF